MGKRARQRSPEPVHEFEEDSEGASGLDDDQDVFLFRELCFLFS